MTSRLFLSVSCLAFVGSATRVEAESPCMLFRRADIPALRARAESAEYAALWASIVRQAEALSTPGAPGYADPADPYPAPAKSAYMDQSRHDMLLVHRIGGQLTQRMEALGFAYQLTGREEFGRHGAALLLATTEKYPVTLPVVSKGFAGGRGDIMRGLAVGYDLLSERLDADQRRTVAAVCAGYIEFFREEFENPKSWWYRVHNYNGVNGGAAGCLALALKDAYPDKVDEWTTHSRQIIDRWLAAAFDAEGAFMEGVGYSGYGLSNTVLFGDALRRNGGPNLFEHPTFRALPNYYALSLLPGENVFDARNDSNYVGLNVTALKLADVGPNGGLYRWLWDQTGSDHSFLSILWHNTVPPLDPVAAGVPTAVHFRGRGLCAWRTGWNRGDVMLSIEAGPYLPVTHNQADKGHFTLYGLGFRWATDPGYANEHGPKGRGQVLAHSCVLIDGKGQALSGAGWGTNGVIRRYENCARFGYALADCTEAYNRNNAGKPGAGADHALRHTFFVYPHADAPAYAIVLDDIRKDDQPHEFAWQMMLADGMAVTLGEGRAVLEPYDASENAYVETPATAPETLTAVDPQQGACRFDLDVSAAGEYTIWARVRTLAEETGKSDSFFVQMDDGKPLAWHMPGKRTWTWGRVASGTGQDPVAFKLEPGRHTLAFLPREPGAQLDCLLVTLEREKPPSLPVPAAAGLFFEAEAGAVTAPMRSVRCDPPEARLVVRIHADSAPVLSTDVFAPEDYHGPAAFPRLRAVAQTVTPNFMAVLLPLPAGVKEPDVSFSSEPTARALRIAWPGHEDVLTWPHDGAREPEFR